MLINLTKFNNSDNDGIFVDCAFDDELNYINNIEDIMPISKIDNGSFRVVIGGDYVSKNK